LTWQKEIGRSENDYSGDQQEETDHDPYDDDVERDWFHSSSIISQHLNRFCGNESDMPELSQQLGAKFLRPIAIFRLSS
jgi:hypothetical protein